MITNRNVSAVAILVGIGLLVGSCAWVMFRSMYHAQSAALPATSHLSNSIAKIPTADWASASKEKLCVQFDSVDLRISSVTVRAVNMCETPLPTFAFYIGLYDKDNYRIAVSTQLMGAMPGHEKIKHVYSFVALDVRVSMADVAAARVLPLQ